MSFTPQLGYTPRTLNSLLDEFRVNINTAFGTSYTTSSFVGTNWYKYFYAASQILHENEIKTAEVYAKLTEFVSETNARILRPTVSTNGLMEACARDGFTVSVKAPANADAGKIFVAALLDSGDSEYAAQKLALCTLLSQFVAAGMVTQGDQVEELTLTNGQQFDFKYDLPDDTPILLRATVTESPHNLLLIEDDVAVRQRVFDNIAARYRLGWNFEPQRYLSTADFPWASEILLEYSTNVDTPSWEDTVYEADYDEIFTFGLDDITVVID